MAGNQAVRTTHPQFTVPLTTGSVFNLQPYVLQDISPLTFTFPYKLNPCVPCISGQTKFVAYTFKYILSYKDWGKVMHFGVDPSCIPP